jgi:hypothetical protein
MPYGAQIKFGIARQTATNSAGAVTIAGSFHHVPLVSEDVGYEKSEIISENLIGRFEQGAVFDGTAIVQGTIEFEPLPKSLGAILTAICGPCATGSAVVSGSTNFLPFVPRTSDTGSGMVLNPMTIYKQFSDSNSAEQFYDCQIGQLEFTFAQGALARARATVVGGNRTVAIGSLALPLDTAEAGQGWLWDVTSISMGGGAISNLSEITVALNEGVEPVYTLNGTLTPYKYARGSFREVTVSGTALFDSRSLFNDFIAGTQRQLLITSRNTRYAIQSGYFPTFTIDIPQLKITEMKPGASGPGELQVSFTGRGVVDPSSSYSIKYTLLSSYFIAANSGSSPY